MAIVLATTQMLCVKVNGSRRRGYSFCHSQSAAPVAAVPEYPNDLSSALFKSHNVAEAKACPPAHS